MLKLSCPSCGAEVKFQSNFSVYGNCSYCQTLIVRHDLDLTGAGKAAILPPDMSPFQLGSHGVYHGKEFELIGRVKVSWSDGNWNEWYALFRDGREGWLAEAQGFLMMSFPEYNISNVPKREAVFAGRSLPLFDNEIFHIDDIKKTVCVGSEGELPLHAFKGREALSIDLSGPNQKFASIDYFENETRLYLGEFKDFDEFKFGNLRELDGW